jgi:flagellin
MSELATLALDVTKSTDDTELYQTEYDSLASQLDSMTGEQFNGIDLFAAGTTLEVTTSQDGGQTVGITQADLATDVFDEVDGLALTDAATLTTITTAIQSLATLRATNGSEQTRLTFAADMLAVNKTNLEAANGRITDVDIASESANLARLNILQQAGTAMLAQANQSNQSILRLLM